MPHLRVRNFEKFQHYRDGRAVKWIKLYSALLDNYEWSQLKDDTKGHLVAIWILAARMQNRLPNDPEWIRERIGARNPVDVENLVKLRFLELSHGVYDLVQEEEGEGEGETDTTSLRKSADAVVENETEGGGQHGTVPNSHRTEADVSRLREVRTDTRPDVARGVSSLGESHPGGAQAKAPRRNGKGNENAVIVAALREWSTEPVEGGMLGRELSVAKRIMARQRVSHDAVAVAIHGARVSAVKPKKRPWLCYVEAAFGALHKAGISGQPLDADALELVRRVAGEMPG